MLNRVKHYLNFCLKWRLEHPVTVCFLWFIIFLQFAWFPYWLEVKLLGIIAMVVWYIWWTIVMPNVWFPKSRGFPRYFILILWITYQSLVVDYIYVLNPTPEYPQWYGLKQLCRWIVIYFGPWA